MINFSNYYYLVILLIVRITTCQTNDSNITDIKIDVSHDSSGSADGVSGSYLKFNPDICELPIDEGDCRNESLGTDEDSDNDSDSVINELYQLDDLNGLIGLNELNQSNEHDKLSESNESNSFYFGYNKNTKNCEPFNYDGCGGNANRFDTINDCRKTCYTPLKNFLAKVTDLLVSRVTNGTSELPAT